MATTTPNFGWPVPTSTDLVKDGATAIEALGDGIDTSMVDLKGGLTGQVLAKATNADMDFSWVTSDDANAIQNTIVDAKGDLIAASAADTPARLAVGNNGETLVADSSTSTGLRYQSAYNGNAIINGGLDIWQRGTSFAAPTSNTFVADRWAWQSSSVATKTISRQASGLTGFQYGIRVARDSGNSNTASNYIGYSMETSDAIRFSGQTVTFSFYAKAGANYSPTSSLLGYRLASGTGTDQNLLTGGYTGNVNLLDSTQAITTTYTRYSFTATVGSTATELGLFFYSTPTGTAGANDWFEITGVQIELGSVATTFKRAGGGTIQGELSACQRYYVRLTAGTTNYNPITPIGGAVSTTAIALTLQPPTTMRTAPSSIEFASMSVYGGSSGGFGFLSVSALALTRATGGMLELEATVSGATAGGFYRLQPNNAAGYVGVIAEL
jgi:hypothetical protein